MDREEQIRQASIDYSFLKGTPMCICGDAFAEMADELNRNRAFEEGAKWADSNPVNIWHNADEKPKKLNQWFIAQIGDDAFDTFVMAMEKDEDWKHWSNGINMRQWAYISDLLPKGGEQ